VGSIWRGTGDWQCGIMIVGCWTAEPVCYRRRSGTTLDGIKDGLGLGWSPDSDLHFLPDRLAKLMCVSVMIGRRGVGEGT